MGAGAVVIYIVALLIIIWFIEEDMGRKTKKIEKEAKEEKP